MIHNPEVELPVFHIHRMYCSVKRETPSLRFGQYFLNIAYPHIQDPKLFYCEDDKEAMMKIMFRYCYTDGQLKPVNDELIQK